MPSARSSLALPKSMPSESEQLIADDDLAPPSEADAVLPPSPPPSARSPAAAASSPSADRQRQSATTPTMDHPAAYLPNDNEEMQDHLPSPVIGHTATANANVNAATGEENLKLLKPENVKSRYWLHFSKYDQEYHPDKKTTARCNICGKDISVKQGTGGLKNHLKFKHPEEFAALQLADENDIHGTLHPADNNNGTPSSSRLGGVGGNTPAQKKKIKRESTNVYTDLSIRMDTEKRNKDKHLMEMWSMTRREIRELRKELKDEEDEDVVRELEGDVRVLRKRKGDYAEKLGFKDDFEMVTDV